MNSLKILTELSKNGYILSMYFHRALMYSAAFHHDSHPGRAYYDHHLADEETDLERQ